MRCLRPFSGLALALSLLNTACQKGQQSAISAPQPLPPQAKAEAEAPAVEDLLVDDFEDGDSAALNGNGWYQWTDADNGGRSTLSIPGAEGAGIRPTGEGHGSARGLTISYKLDKGTWAHDPYVGFGVGLGHGGGLRDLSKHEGIGYTYRGAAHSVRLQTAEVADYDFFAFELPASPDWKTVRVPFSAFRQGNWGQKVAFNRAHANGISFQIQGATGVSGTLQIDDLKVIASKITEALTPGVTFALEEPAPPALEAAGSLAISNPLQKKALRSLNRGYNITNWLEEKRFSGFTYDEAFVAKLARAGFTSLRLPVDLDRYVAPDGPGKFKVDADLFKVLDAFDAWTKKHGLSLTIDYHAYDKSLTLAEESVALAVGAWGKVAEHFAANPRDDLFFELLNEPELSFGGTPPTQEEWTRIAEQMIAAIRAHDKRHTIIFGDVRWYGIVPLTQRVPFRDKNVIYAFHSYEPFVFTHQGATWSGTGTMHDIPYPYSVDRWVEDGGKLGFTPAMEAWILRAARDYARTGNRAALYNQILAAKRWGVKHNVPVICNEFGAYDRSSRSEDRVRYYTDVIGVFEALEIPWQHWFMIMDGNGDVSPEYKRAFRLSP